MNLKSVKNNVSVLNILLAGIAVAVYMSAVVPLSHLKSAIRIPIPVAAPLKPLSSNKELQLPSLADFTVIADKNLFHPERIIPVEKINQQPEPRPEIILYGTIVSDHMRIAYIEEKRGAQPGIQQPGGATDRNKSQKAMKLGERVGSYVLTSIEDDSITFAKGDDKIFISLKDPQQKGRKPALAQESSRSAPVQDVRNLPRRRMPATVLPGGAAPGIPAPPVR